MNKLFTTILFLLYAFSGSPFSLKGQTPLQKVMDQVDSSKGLQITFALEGQLSQERVEGTYYAHGQRFYLESPIMKAWYNGNLLWVYIFQNGEINLSTPTSEDLAEINPLTNLELMQRRDMMVKQNACPSGYLLVATPKIGYQGYITSIEAEVNKEFRPIVLRVYDKSSDKPLVAYIKKIQKGTALPTTLFEYSSDKAPGVPVIDLR